MFDYRIGIFFNYLKEHPPEAVILGLQAFIAIIMGTHVVSVLRSILKAHKKYKDESRGNY